MKTICVAGASGLVGSHIVKAALARGYRVNGTLRDAGDATKVPYLKALPGAEERLTLFSAEAEDEASFNPPLRGTDAVFIACFPSIHKGKDGTPATEMAEKRAWDEIIRPIEEGCLNILRAACRQGVKNVILGSSTASANPRAPVDIKNEVDHVSDAEDQIRNKKFTAAQKTVMEASARRFAEEHGQRLCILLPSMIVGPVLLPQHLEGHVIKLMADLLDGKKGWHHRVPAGSMSLSHPEDVAALFLSAYENPKALGRYFAFYDSWPWRDLYADIAKHVPESGLPAPLDAEAEAPTRYDFTRRDSMGVAMRDIPRTLAETFAWLKSNPFGRSA